LNDIRDIKQTISRIIVKKIFGNTRNAFEFLVLNGYDVKDLKKRRLRADELYDEIVRIWNYENAKNIIRDLFKNKPKFISSLNGEKTINILVEEWKNLNLGNIDWPFSQGKFDEFVQRLNSQNTSREIKDVKVKESAVKYRRIKELNTERNDFIETLIFLNNEKITPTFSHTKGLDFFINGIG